MKNEDLKKKEGEDLKQKEEYEGFILKTYEKSLHVFKPCKNELNFYEITIKSILDDPGLIDVVHNPESLISGKNPDSLLLSEIVKSISSGDNNVTLLMASHIDTWIGDKIQEIVLKEYNGLASDRRWTNIALSVLSHASLCKEPKNKFSPTGFEKLDLLIDNLISKFIEENDTNKASYILYKISGVLDVLSCLHAHKSTLIRLNFEHSVSDIKEILDYFKGKSI